MGSKNSKSNPTPHSINYSRNNTLSRRKRRLIYEYQRYVEIERLNNPNARALSFYEFENIRNEVDLENFDQEIIIEKSKPKKKIKKLNIYHLISLEDKDIIEDIECPICLDEFKKGDKCYLLPCNHYFHQECLEDWFSKDKICPSCRLPLGKHSLEEVDKALHTRQIKLDKIDETFNEIHSN